MTGSLLPLVLIGVGIASGQPTFVKPRRGEPKAHPQSAMPLLDPNQSSVYMEFKRIGRCLSQDREQASDRIWLTLRNNTRWTISIRANGVETECYGDASPFYRVEVSEWRAPDGPIPYGHWFDVSSVVEIESGTTLTFSVPKTDLDPGLGIRVDFKFTWEENNLYTRHSSHFSYWDLPERLRDKAKEKKLKCVSVSAPCINSQPNIAPQPTEFPVPPILIPTPHPGSPPPNE